MAQVLTLDRSETLNFFIYFFKQETLNFCFALIDYYMIWEQWTNCWKRIMDKACYQGLVRYKKIFPHLLLCENKTYTVPLF